MTDEGGQKVSQQPESRPPARMSTANLPAADHRNARIVPIVTRLFRYPATRQRLSYGITLGVPLLLLGALVFGMGESPLVALLVSALTYAGLFMFFIWKPQIELERETIAGDVKKRLAKSREIVDRIKRLTPELRPLLSGGDGETRLGRIGSLADRALAKLDGIQGTSLGTADRLETRLSEFSTILELFQKTADAETASSPSLTPLGEEVVQKILPLMELWLADLSTSLKAEDALNLDVAMRVMRDTLESEGLSRTE
jgi:hypothetical protein